MYTDFDFANLLKELKERREKVYKCIADSPKGSIVPDRQYGRTYLIYCKKDVNGSDTRIRLTKRPELLHSLMRKKYLEAEAGLLEKNIAALERFSTKYKEITPENIIKALPQTYRELPEKLFFIPIEAEIDFGLTNIAGVAAYEELCEELGSLRGANKGKNVSNAHSNGKSLRKNAAGRKTGCENLRICGIGSSGWSGDEQGIKWLLTPYERSDFMAEELKHTTSRGLKVRSKGELLVTEALYKYDVPFRYEEVLLIDGLRLVPDFTIRRRDGSLCYWEHCGLMGDADYRERQRQKFRLYERADIVPWKNLIVTYDGEDGGINIAVIESEIRNKLL